MRALIAAASVAHADETTARAAGALTYLHVACTRFLTAMHVGDRRRDTIDVGGIWPAFTGVLVRDGYGGYEHLDQIEHAWCGIHLVRDLRAVHDPDPEGQSWAEAMVNTLLLANDTAHAARAEGRGRLTDTELSTIASCYAGAIARGWQENATGRDPLHEQARTLLRRFQRHRDMILRFTVNLDVPFTNNTAELPARAAKIQQRTSGGSWRTLQGLIDFAVVQSYLSTTPLSPVSLLTAQLVVNLVAAMLSIGLLVAVGNIAFHVAMPRQFLGFLITLIFLAASLFTIGLLVAGDRAQQPWCQRDRSTADVADDVHCGNVNAGVHIPAWVSSLPWGLVCRPCNAPG